MTPEVPDGVDRRSSAAVHRRADGDREPPRELRLPGRDRARRVQGTRPRGHVHLARADEHLGHGSDQVGGVRAQRVPRRPDAVRDPEQHRPRQRRRWQPHRHRRSRARRDDRLLSAGRQQARSEQRDRLRPAPGRRRRVTQTALLGRSKRFNTIST